MLSIVVFLPLLAAAVLGALRRLPDTIARWCWLGVSLTEVCLVTGLWWAFRSRPPGRLAFEERITWMPSVGSSYHVGVDGLSLPLLAVTVVVFAAAAGYALHEDRRPRTQAALFLALECTCLGLFVAQDLILFFLFFDLSIVGMYFVIAGWGHRGAARSALMFFLYTFTGSLALLLGFIGLYLSAIPHTFDIPELVAAAPLQDRGVLGSLVLAALLLGLAVKTPTFPFHTWLPPAHTDAPAVGSAVLAGVLLKMGTYGFVRIAMPTLPQAWRDWAGVIVAVGIVSVLYGALVALAQTDVKRMIAYTSVNHMGYVVLAVGAAGVVSTSDTQARTVAVSGAVTQMVSHGLVTGGLFLLAGVLFRRRGSYAMADYGGLAGPAPWFAGFFAVAAFASLGLPGFSGFIAEFQIFTGSIGALGWAALALPGILITAAVFLRAIQALLTGPPGPRTGGFRDLRAAETLSVGAMLVLSLVIGLAPRPLLDVIEPAADAVVSLVSR